MQFLTYGDFNYNRGNWKNCFPILFGEGITDGTITHPDSTYPRPVISGPLIIEM